jgi:formimidoylglutamate deiminase
MLEGTSMQVTPENQTVPAPSSLRLWFEAALVAGKWQENVRLTIVDGIISRVELDVTVEPGDERCSVGIPGLANVHSHAFQRGMSGLAEVRGPASDNFWTWREIMYHFLDRLTPEDMEAIASQAYAEMLESGFIRVGEFHYVHHDCAGKPYDNPGELAERICGAAATTGIRLTLLPSFYAHSGFGGLPPTVGQRRFITSPDEFVRLHENAARCTRALPRATVGVAPHSLRAVTPGELELIVALGKDGPIHIHVAEQVKEVADCLAATGARPVEWLLDNAPIDHRWCLIHATHMTPEEINAVARSGGTVGVCPITEANLGDGIFPAAFLAQGGRIGFGTDSNVAIGAAAELCQLEYSQRLASLGRNVLATAQGRSSGRSLYNLALAGGSAALADASAELVAGNPADLVSLACDYGLLAARERGDAVLDRFVFSGRSGHAVDKVWIGGEEKVSAGRHYRREEIAVVYRRTMRRLLSQ